MPIRFTPSMAADLRELLAQTNSRRYARRPRGRWWKSIPAAATLHALKPLPDPKRKDVERRSAAEGLGELSTRWRSKAGSVLAGQSRRGSRRNRDPLRCSIKWGRPSWPRPDRGWAMRMPPFAACVWRRSSKLPVPWNRRRRSTRSACAVKAQVKGVADRLADTDLAVCLAAHQTLETVAARRKLFQVPEQQAKGLPPALPDGIQGAVPQLVKSLSHKEVRVRWASLYALERWATRSTSRHRGGRPAPKDENGSVRWCAVRALNKMAPAESERAVPALAGILTDANKTVRLTAVYALDATVPRQRPP